MNKKTFFWLLIEWLAYFGIVYWLVGGSIWLDLLLTSVLTHTAHLTRQVNRQRLLFDIADAELVRVSALANRLDEDLGEFQGKLELAESKISDLESERAHFSIQRS